MDKEKMLSTGQVALRLRMSSTRILQLCRAGKLPATDTPIGYLYALSDVREFERARRKKKRRRVG